MSSNVRSSGAGGVFCENAQAQKNQHGDNGQRRSFHVVLRWLVFIGLEFVFEIHLLRGGEISLGHSLQAIFSTARWRIIKLGGCWGGYITGALLNRQMRLRVCEEATGRCGLSSNETVAIRGPF